MKNLLSIFLSIVPVCLFAPISIVAQESQETQPRTETTLQGRVTDASTGEPIGKVKVIIIGSSRSAVTDRSGGFVFHDLRSGEIELYITTIGYGLVKKRVTLRDGENNEVQIALHQEAAQRLDGLR